MTRPRYDLTLFVGGASELSAHAVTRTRALCDARLRGRYDLSVVNVHEDPDAAARSGVLATPTLVRNHPPPVRRIVGDLSASARVLRALDLPVGPDDNSGKVLA